MLWKNLVYPVHILGQKFKDCIDLLLIMDENKPHYVYIKDFNRFMCNKTRCKNKENTFNSHFNHNFVMSEKDEQKFQYWICDKLFDVGDNEVTDNCHITGKYKGKYRSAHWSCNINLRLTKTLPVIFYNLRGYDSHLIIREIGKFDVKVNFIPNGLEKYMAFTIHNKSLSTACNL